MKKKEKQQSFDANILWVNNTCDTQWEGKEPAHWDNDILVWEP